jgi:hypothetical protein
LERDVIEIGSRVIAGVQRARDPQTLEITGAKLWAGDMLLLDNREGKAPISW